MSTKQNASEETSDLIREITRIAVQFGFSIDPQLNPNRPAGFPITYEELVNHPAKVGYYSISKWMSEISSVWDWQKFIADYPWFLEKPQRLTITYVDGLLPSPAVASKENSKALFRAIVEVLVHPQQWGVEGEKSGR